MAGPLTATVDVGGPFKIETKPYNIAAKVELAADEKPSTPAVKPAEVTEEKPETSKAESVEPAPVTAQADESPAAKSKGRNWIILSALIGLGVVAAGVAIYNKTV